VAVSGAAAEASPLESVFREHHARVFRAAYRITGNAHDAEEVLQTVFLRLLQQGEAAPAVENPASYLYRAAVNAALDLLRSSQVRRSVPLDAVAGRQRAVAPTPEEQQDAAELRRWLRRALAELPPRAAAIFALRHLEGQPNHEIARTLGISRITVAVTLHRARIRLRRAFRGWTRERP
jgi:RNA polymerase sigma-70 factor (ECF subfamily)